MPRVPFSDSHRERVNSLVELVENSNGLDNVVIIALDRELDLGARVSMTETKLGGSHVSFAKLLQHLGGMESNSTEHILNDFTGIAGFAINKWEGRFDASSERLVANSQNHLFLLTRLGKIQFQEGNKSIGRDTLRDIINFTKGLLVVSISRKKKVTNRPRIGRTYSKGRKLESWTILPNLARSSRPS